MMFRGIIVSLVLFSCNNELSKVQALQTDQITGEYGLVDAGVYIDSQLTTTNGEIYSQNYANRRWTGDLKINRSPNGYDKEKHMAVSPSGYFFLKMKALNTDRLELSPYKIEIIKGSIVEASCESLGYSNMDQSNFVEINVSKAGQYKLCEATDKVVRPPHHKPDAVIYMLPVVPSESGDITAKITWKRKNSQKSALFNIVIANLKPNIMSEPPATNPDIVPELLDCPESCTANTSYTSQLIAQCERLNSFTAQNYPNRAIVDSNLWKQEFNQYNNLLAQCNNNQTSPDRPTNPIPGGFSKIMSAVEKSSCTTYRWKDRGRAPLGYVKGVTLAYVKALCNRDRDYVQLVSRAKTSNSVKDVLTWYNSIFASHGISNSVSGNEPLRSSYLTLFGLGMRESSGKYCSGRDMSANFSSASSAEAGIFQASWGSRKAAEDILVSMFDRYKNGQEKCFLDVFKEKSPCSSISRSWGDGEGAQWQQLTKQCPMFATEWAAVLMRTTAGSKGEFGPLRRHASEINGNCHSMLKEVEKITLESDVCSMFEND